MFSSLTSERSGDGHIGIKACRGVPEQLRITVVSLAGELEAENQFPGG